MQQVLFIPCFRCKSHVKKFFSGPRESKGVKNMKFSLAGSSQQLVLHSSCILGEALKKIYVRKWFEA